MPDLGALACVLCAHRSHFPPHPEAAAGLHLLPVLTMRTWIKLFIFLIPPGIVFGIPLLTLWMGGELTTPETVIKRQASTSRLVLHGAALSNTIIYEKVRAMQLRKPEILALGTSRVLQ